MPQHKPQLSSRPLVSQAALNRLAQSLDPETKRRLSRVVRLWAQVKEAGGRVVVATGSGPNLHEGVTCMVAELVRLGLVDGVLTSSAVVGHEMAGVLERVRRVEGAKLGLDPAALPADGKVEVSLLSPEQLAGLARQTIIDRDLYRRMLSAPGNDIIKVAGNLAYPTGLWVERTARKLEPMAKAAGLPLEAVTGPGCDPLTMLGACARRGVPCLVTVPQLVGGGQVGLAVGDSISISSRSARVADLLASADLIIESGVALTQEIHDGPFELFTGHGLWARHEGLDTFSLGQKAVVRIDLDPNLERAWRMQQDAQAVAQAIDQGKPKATGMKLPFRMEMSGFARLPGALPLTGDLGVIWPLLASRAAKAMGVKTAFLCYKQGTPPGEAVRQYIVTKLSPLDHSQVVQALKEKSLWP
ncbi:MAG: hypothetical protein KMY53_08430 [Desulfarculus sp.]|nr:hypothetical protein [Pseudomonadota bacterium]MBV1716099.1 hypothetical protein [Desulfarculus sp.]MBU4574822.1 hypothetical protein [Pseudomonadota bacterium]MBU4596385.1 hypothetical protein [Pseudomonadota bacterium]MBV1738174.1 hypothetical protein [Desulfarculus sp.]